MLSCDQGASQQVAPLVTATSLTVCDAAAAADEE
jgi:hypothetical protein